MQHFQFKLHFKFCSNFLDKSEFVEHYLVEISLKYTPSHFMYCFQTKVRRIFNNGNFPGEARWEKVTYTLELKKPINIFAKITKKYCE